MSWTGKLVSDEQEHGKEGKFGKNITFKVGISVEVRNGLLALLFFVLLDVAKHDLR